MKKEKIKNKCLITISISFLLISTGLQLSTMLEKETPYEISYEYVNVKDMAQAKVTNKVEKEMVKEPITTSLVQLLSKNSFSSIKSFQTETKSLNKSNILNSSSIKKKEKAIFSK